MVRVAVPHTGDVCTPLVKRLIELDKQDGVEVCFSKARPVDVNRCEIANRFVDGDHGHEWLVMVDSDIVPPENVLELTETDCDLVSGVVYSSRHGVPFPAGAVERDGSFTQFSGVGVDEADTLIELDGVGTGCIAIHKSVFAEMDRPYFAYRRNGEGGLDTGEDFDFCRRASVKPVMHTDVVCGHRSVLDVRKVMESLTLAFEKDPDDVVFGNG